MEERHADALLLDIGGVVLLSGAELVARLGGLDARFAAESARLGVVGSPGDELWQRMLRREVSEREYWADRAARLGRAVGETWDTRALMTRLYDAPQPEWMRSTAVDFMREVRAAGRRLGALSNDMVDFHGREWVEGQDWLRLFDVVVDGSSTGVLKPDPVAYKVAIEALEVPAERIVFIDDLPWNVEGATEAGMIGVRFYDDDPAAAFATARAYLGLTARGE